LAFGEDGRFPPGVRRFPLLAEGLPGMAVRVQRGDEIGAYPAELAVQDDLAVGALAAG